MLSGGMLIGLAAGANAIDRNRYAVIELKCPFGKAPPAIVAPVVQPEVVKKDEDALRTIRLSHMRRSATGIRCGFQKENISAMLMVGELDEALGITLVDADYQNGAAKIKKGAAETWIYLDGMRTGAPSQSAQPSASGLSAQAPGIAKTSRARKREIIRHRHVEPPNLTGEELESHLQEQAMESIRTGAPPLPVQLTPESDAKMVEEGFLPPME